MVVVALLSVDLVESVDLVSVELVVNCIGEMEMNALESKFEKAWCSSKKQGKIYIATVDD